MKDLVHRAPSVGALVNKCLAINPELGPAELIDIIKQSIKIRGTVAGEFSSAEVVDEEKALRLARETLRKRP